MALLKLLCDIIALSILIKHLFQFFEGLLQLLNLDTMCLRLFFVLVEEEVEINSLIKVKPAVILDQFLLLHIKVHSVQLEKHDVWRAAYPGLQDFCLPLNVSFIAFNFRPTATFPSLVQISFINSKLNGS